MLGSIGLMPARTIRVLAMIALGWLSGGPAWSTEHLRIGLLATGTVAWQIDVIRRHELDQKAGLEFETLSLASPDAAKLALNAGSVDIAVSDWLWVVRERALGAKLQFFPYSTAVGAVMARIDGPVASIADLKGRRLAVAGGPLDKSWLILQAAALKTGVDLGHDTTLVFGAPPLLYQKTLDGEAEATLEFWNYCAQLEAKGFRRVLDIGQAERDLGLAAPVAMTGYVFSEAFAKDHKAALDAFLQAAHAANEILATSDAEWEALRPMMRAGDEATFAAYRAQTRAGIPHRPRAEETTDAARLFAILAAAGGDKLVGPGTRFDPGLYYAPRAGE